MLCSSTPTLKSKLKTMPLVTHLLASIRSHKKQTPQSADLTIIRQLILIVDLAQANLALGAAKAPPAAQALPAMQVSAARKVIPAR